MKKIKGSVYIVSHPQMVGLVKIGMTTKPLKERLSSLYNTSVPGPFTLEHHYSVINVTPRAFELSIHRHLDQYRINPRREFFKLEPDEAIKKVSQMLNSRGSSYKFRRRARSFFKFVIYATALVGLLYYARPHFPYVISTITDFTTRTVTQ